MCPQAQVQDENVFPRKKVRCVLVHEHVLLRQGLRRLLEDEPDLEVVGEASNAVEALQNVFQTVKERIPFHLCELRCWVQA